MSHAELEDLLGDERVNAVVAWLLVAVVVVVGIEELIVGDFLWAVFAIVVAALAIVPPIAHGSRGVMLPWEVLLMAALPVIGLALGASRLTGHFAAYLAVAAVALVITVELQVFTSVRMTPGFAIVLVVVGTMAAAGLWALTQWAFDIFLGTDLITDNDSLMWEFVYSAVAGLGAGIVFEVYFRRSMRAEKRIPEDVVPGGVVREEVLDE